MIYMCSFHMPGSKNSLFITIKQRDQESFCMATMMSFHILQQHYLFQRNILHLQKERRKNNSWFKTCTMLWMLYSFLWVILRCLNFICQRFGTLCLSQVVWTRSHDLWRWTECSKTLALEIQMLGNHPKERV